MIMINHILQIMDVRKHIQKLYKKEIFKVLFIYIINKQKKQKKDLDYNKQRKEIQRKLYVSHKNGLKEIFQNF
jgi:ribosomal protein L23